MRGILDYPICFEEDFSNLAQVMREEGLADRKICIVTDSNVGPLYEAPVKKALSEVSSDISVFTFEAGEKNKNLDTVSSLYQALISNGLDRKSLLVALGGGVVGDLTGFGAATYLRGIDFIQVPTTLLAQVDSSVGGKTGVDFQQYKNMVGAFHQPRLVYMNMSTLSSLPAEQFACGMGEILKTGLICDEEFFRFVCREQKEIKKLDMKRIARMVRRCCEIKAGVVERDPKEQGERALLNLGHTVGHAVEKLKNFTLLHGQCVGAGLVAAAYLSMKRGLLTEEEYQEIRQGCADYDLPVHVDGLIPEEVLLATKKDKKMEQGHIKFILMDGIGKSFIDKTVTDEELLILYSGDNFMISRVNHHQKMSPGKCLAGDIFLMILLVAADQVAKWLSYLYLKGQLSISLIPGVLELHYLYPENRGIAFGMFQGSVLFFAIVSVLFLGVILYAWIRIPKERFYLPLLTIATVLAAGALGNFIDRFFRGYVIDFIYFSLIDFPVFNLADIYVVASGIFLILFVCTKYRDDDFSFLNIKR